MIFKIFSIFFSRINRISTEFFFKYKKIAKIIIKIFFKLFCFVHFFYENFSFHKNISAKIVFTIFSRISFVFDVCEIMYFAKFFIVNFAYCKLFCFCNFGVRKKNCKFFLRFFFSALNVSTEVENFSFLKKSKIFSDRIFGFLYSLLGK